MTTVYTIGYEGASIDSFIETLSSLDIKVLADVRALALSRKKGFSKAALRKRLESEGIVYRHFPRLGDPKPGREAARLGQYDLFRKIYVSHLSMMEPNKEFEELAEISQQMKTCMLCFERDPDTCHRSIIGEKLTERGIDVFDLYGDVPDRYVKYPIKRTRSNTGEGLAAAE